MSEVKTVARRGRPIVSNSARQVRLEIRAQKVVSGLSISRGRPTDTQSARQVRLAEKAAKIAAGIEIKRGAPKKVKAEEVKAEAVSE
jgi:hypothetical protein